MILSGTHKFLYLLCEPDLQCSAGAIHIELRPKGVFPVAYEAKSFPYRGTALLLSYGTGHTERRYNTGSGSYQLVDIAPGPASCGECSHGPRVMAYFLFSFIGPSQYIAHPSQYFE